jgi:hypothetical protein
MSFSIVLAAQLTIVTVQTGARYVRLKSACQSVRFHTYIVVEQVYKT